VPLAAHRPLPANIAKGIALPNFKKSRREFIIWNIVAHLSKNSLTLRTIHLVTFQLGGLNLTISLSLYKVSLMHSVSLRALLSKRPFILDRHNRRKCYSWGMVTRPQRPLAKFLREGYLTTLSPISLTLSQPSVWLVESFKECLVSKIGPTPLPLPALRPERQWIGREVSSIFVGIYKRWLDVDGLLESGLGKEILFNLNF
jgi:hypothetical protein